MPYTSNMSKEDKEKFTGCDIELVNNEGTFRGPIKSIREEGGKMIFETLWMARLDHLRGWIITDRFKKNIISFVISRARAVGYYGNGKTREIRTVLGRIYLSLKDQGQLDRHNVHNIGCSTKCLGCVAG